jgi:hypothetical protein
MQFDYTINIGQIVTLVSFFGGLVAAWYAVKSDLRSIDARVVNVERDTRGQIEQNARIIGEVGAVRQDVAVIRDRVTPPPISAQAPSKGSPS